MPCGQQQLYPGIHSPTLLFKPKSKSPLKKENTFLWENIGGLDHKKCDFTTGQDNHEVETLDVVFINSFINSFYKLYINTFFCFLKITPYVFENLKSVTLLF